ncbi:MAG: LuxR C-terminal-related transcriptional regulator [Treponema sp.]|jgi:DNA-binding CsgD family transcriptional regulator|nr:LuxR C-terminal-related transcriptional regulator [Treponema sp.]
MNKEKFKLFFSRQALVYTMMITLAFSLLVFLCIVFMGNNESRHIRNDAKAALDTTELNIISDFVKMEKLLVYISETVRKMILQGGNFDTVSEYITHITGFMFADEELKLYTSGFYGCFDVFGGKSHFGIGWQPPEGYAPADRPWYKAAVKANGEVGITDSYYPMGVHEISLSFARRIFDDNGKPLGIVCLDVLLDKIRELAVNTRFEHNGYGLLLNSQLEVLAHPDKELWGKNMKDIDSGLASLAKELMQGMPVLERRVKNYRNDASVIFTRQLKNGWYIGVVIPENAYFRDMNIMRLVLIALGTILAALFITLYLRLQKARKELQYYEESLTDLTPREMEIFNLLLTGLPIKQIADKLALTHSGATFHAQNLYRKLGIQSRTELLAKYVNKPDS